VRQAGCWKLVAGGEQARWRDACRFCARLFDLTLSHEGEQPMAIRLAAAAVDSGGLFLFRHWRWQCEGVQFQDLRPLPALQDGVKAVVHGTDSRAQPSRRRRLCGLQTPKPATARQASPLIKHLQPCARRHLCISTEFHSFWTGHPTRSRCSAFLPTPELPQPFWSGGHSAWTPGVQRCPARTEATW